jgi:transposase
MTLYTNFFGIDIGKFSFVVSIHGSSTTTEYENSSSGIAQFVEEHHDKLLHSLCVLETTGGYELELAYSLLLLDIKVHRADTRKVKNFIRSYGLSAKTDALDAKALALYGYERCDKLALFKAQSAESIILFQLAQRLGDLKTMLVAEKNRLQSPTGKCIKDSIVMVINILEEELKGITDKIEIIINNNPELKKKSDILKTIPGIGDIVAFELLILLPELGTLCRRKIASLAGVAPRANDSGKFSGYRRTGHGRSGVKPILFLAAMAARRSKTHLKEFFQKLISAGKKKMVALTALMRKILVIANAKIKENFYLKT